MLLLPIYCHSIALLRILLPQILIAFSRDPSPLAVPMLIWDSMMISFSTGTVIFPCFSQCFLFYLFFISVFVFGIWIEIVEVDLALKVLHDAALDWDAASEICAYCGYREHCYVRSLLHLRAMWHTPGCYLYFITLNIYFKGYILINLLVRSYLIWFTHNAYQECET